MRNISSTALLLGITILLLDLVSKFFIHHTIPLMSYDTLWYPYGGIPVFKNFIGIEFSIVHATNKGAAWGVFANYQEYLLIVRMVLVTGLIGYLAFVNKNKGIVIPLIMVVAGAIGNISDFFFYGHVVDMFHFVLWGYDYPVFNVADISITMGILYLCVSSYCCKPTSAKPKKAKG